MFIVTSTMLGCILFAYRRWKRRKLPGYNPLHNEEDVDLDDPMREKRTVSATGRILRGVFSQIRSLSNHFIPGRGAETDGLPTMGQAKDEDDTSAI
jgi:hypothetical protein